MPYDTPGTNREDSHLRHTPEKTIPTPDTKHAAQLLFFSFRFSQGNQSIQRYIFDYLHHINPQWKITSADRTVIEEQTKMMVTKFFDRQRGLMHLDFKGVHPIGNYFEMTVGNMLSDLCASLNTNHPYNFDTRIDSLVQSLIWTEHKHLSADQGRPRKNAGEHVGPDHDPYLSHICWYGILGKSTGMPEYDMMFRDIISYIQNNWEDIKNKEPAVADKLLFIIKKFNDTHPDNQVSFIE